MEKKQSNIKQINKSVILSKKIERDVHEPKS